MVLSEQGLAVARDGMHDGCCMVAVIVSSCGYCLVRTITAHSSLE